MSNPRPSPDRSPGRWLVMSVAPVALALSLGLSATARAELAVVGKPNFSAADRNTIARNEILRRRVASDPWLVYRVLRALDVAAAGRARDGLPARDPGAARADFDGKRDPDLDRLERAAPEAAHDLFLLLKKAGGAGQTK